jgi:glycosyltransferase involved in cell wall biosynthesis
MKVSVAVFGRFHAFNLAQQLQKHGHLQHLISSYPSFFIRKFGISPAHICSIWHLELWARLCRRLPQRLQNLEETNFQLLKQFDQLTARSLKDDIDVFTGWSGSCLDSFHRARALGAVTIVERGSSHIAYQSQILQEEYDRWGMECDAIHPGIYERELAAYQVADRIAVPSAFAKQTFLDQGIAEHRLIHVPYGASLSEFHPVPKEDNVFRIIHCGALSLRKGVPYLLQAFHELNLPDAELWLVGSVNSEIEPFLAKYQSDRILLKGVHPQNQLRWFYSQCSVFCIASIEDGFGMVIPQAMACGLPVIHTTNTGGGDIVRDGIDGFCVPIRDVEALKEKILLLYNDPDRRREISKNALEQARQSLTWDDYGSRIVDAYQTALFSTRSTLSLHSPIR